MPGTSAAIFLKCASSSGLLSSAAASKALMSLEPCIICLLEALSMSPTRNSENFKVLDTGHIDGGAYRWVKFADGSSRVEGWGPDGWKPGGASIREIMDNPPVGAAFASKLGIPPSDLI